MSPERNIFSRIASAFEARRRNKKELNPQSPQEIAREAFLLVSATGSSGQQPIAEYRTDFNILQHKPGTVFRLETRNDYGDQTFAWYAVGKSDKNGVKVFWPYSSNFASLRGDGYYLNFELDDDAMDCGNVLSYFEVKDASHALMPDHPKLDPKDYPIHNKTSFGEVVVEWAHVYKPVKIDVIISGKTKTVKTENRVGSKVSVLKPASLTINSCN